MKRIAIVGMACIVTAAALLTPGLTAGPSFDAAVFLVVSDALAGGASPYVDVWDHKPPGLFVLQAAAFSGLPFMDRWAVAWLLTVLGAAASGVLTGEICARNGVGRAVASFMAVGATAGLSVHVVALGGGMTEQVATAPATAGLALLLTASRTRGWWRWFAAGALVGISVMISFQLAAAGAACLTVALMAPRSLWRTAGVFLIGASAVAGATAAWLLLAGAAPAAIDAIVGYSAAYRATPAADSLTVAGWATLSVSFLLIPATFGVLNIARGRSKAYLALSLPALVWIAAGVALIALSGRVYAHYVGPMSVPLAILAAIGLERAKGLDHLIPRMGGVLGVGVALIANLSQGGVEWRATQAANVAAHEAAAQIRTLSMPGDAIYVWGNQPYTYLLSNRDAASRYVYLLPLTTPGYADAHRIRGMVQELDELSPVVIVDAGSSSPGVAGDLPLLIDRPLITSSRMLDIADPIREFVRANYRQHPVRARWPLYIRNDAPDSALPESTTNE